MVVSNIIITFLVGDNISKPKNSLTIINEKKSLKNLVVSNIIITLANVESKQQELLTIKKFLQL